MSQILQKLNKKIAKVEKLQGVVKMMKNLSASQVYPCRKAVESMAEYERIIQMGFKACMEVSENIQVSLHEKLRDSVEAGSTSRHFVKIRQNGESNGQPAEGTPSPHVNNGNHGATGIIIFGSDRGMVGQYNERVTSYANEQMKGVIGEKVVWAVGDKVYENVKQHFHESFPPTRLPGRIEGITDLVDQLVTSYEKENEKRPISKLFVFYNKMVSETTYEPTLSQVLPLKIHFKKHDRWPTRQVPDVIGGPFNTFIHLLREYIFVSFYKICTESMVSENVSRLLMMEEAEQNISRLLDDLKSSYFLERQNAIDEELFDIISGYEVIEQFHSGA